MFSSKIYHNFQKAQAENPARRGWSIDLIIRRSGFETLARCMSKNYDISHSRTFPP